jgi:molecular chaperone Hsp33
MDPISDFVLPFQLEKAPVRGRLVRLKNSVQDITHKHQYPPVVNRLLAELIALTTALSHLFKFESVFTLQITGDGPVRLMVVDITHEGDIRACARFNEDAVTKLPASTPSIHSVFGSGYLAFTIVQNNADDRYQGIVELEGSTLSECLHHFFRQSDQLETGIVVFANTHNVHSQDHLAAALIVQRMPPASGSSIAGIESEQDDWLRVLSVLGTATAKELLSKDLPVQDLLYRLFWEDGIRVFDYRPLVAKCRCSKDRVEDMLKTFSQVDIGDMIEDDLICVTCEFCNQEYRFDPSSLRSEFPG